MWGTPFFVLFCFVFSSFFTTGFICFCTEPEEARNLQSKGKIPEEHALECLPKVEESLDSWLHFEEVVLKCRERADFPPCVQKDKLKQMIDVDETFEGMLDFYHNRGLIILPGNSLYFHSVEHCFGNLCFVLWVLQTRSKYWTYVKGSRLSSQPNLLPAISSEL